MDDRKSELLEYVRTLYERQNSRASKAGMTYWAILAGIIYVTWHLLSTLADLPVKSTSRLDFYQAFSHMHIALLSLSFLIAVNSFSQHKSELDYRVFRENGDSVAPIIFLLIFLGSPIYATYELTTADVDNLFFPGQTSINFWILSVLLVIFLSYGIYDHIKSTKSSLPPVSVVISKNSKFVQHVSYIGFAIFFELFLGNTLNIAAEVYGSVGASKLQTAAFDVSLIMFGVVLLYRSGRTDEHLSRLAHFERDILIHNLSEKEILERLQDEHLGKYVGDWMDNLLKEVREKGDHLRAHSDMVDDFIAEVDEIDESYNREREGRVNDYISDLEARGASYEKSISPLLEWLKQAGIQAELNKDTFIQSIVDSSFDELQESSKEVRTKVMNAIDTLRSWLNK